MVTENQALNRNKPGFLQTVFRLLLGASLLFAGIGHLTFARTEFLAQVPPWLPLDGDFVVVASGIVEIVLGLVLFYPGRYRIWVGWIVAAFFVAVFPGNLSQYVNRIDGFGLTTDESRLIRLFFQPVLVLWALWSTGAWQAWWQRRQPRQPQSAP